MSRETFMSELLAGIALDGAQTEAHNMYADEVAREEVNRVRDEIARDRLADEEARRVAQKFQVTDADIAKLNARIKARHEAEARGAGTASKPQQPKPAQTASTSNEVVKYLERQLDELRRRLADETAARARAEKENKQLHEQNKKLTASNQKIREAALSLKDANTNLCQQMDRLSHKYDSLLYEYMDSQDMSRRLRADSLHYRNETLRVTADAARERTLRKGYESTLKHMGVPAPKVALPDDVRAACERVRARAQKYIDTHGELLPEGVPCDLSRTSATRVDYLHAMEPERDHIIEDTGQVLADALKTGDAETIQMAQEVTSQISHSMSERDAQAANFESNVEMMQRVVDEEIGLVPNHADEYAPISEAIRSSVFDINDPSNDPAADELASSEERVVNAGNEMGF